MPESNNAGVEQCCDNFLYGFKGAPSARRGLTAPAVNSEDGREQSKGGAARVTRRKRPGFTLGVSPLRGGSFAASFGREPYGAAAAAHGTPGDRPPAVPAVSRCRARPHQRPGRQRRAERRENVTATRAERRALSGLAPPASRAPEDRFQPLRRNDLQDPPLSAGDLCQPSGPDGKGQARGQARNARGEPSTSRTPDLQREPRENDRHEVRRPLSWLADRSRPLEALSMFIESSI
jgi:hypothetical protein